MVAPIAESGPQTSNWRGYNYLQRNRSHSQIEKCLLLTDFPYGERHNFLLDDRNYVLGNEVSSGGNVESRAKLLGHPIHPMLIVFPLGLLATAVAFDIVALSTGDESWFGISFWMMAAGIIGGLLAAVFGVVDWWAIPTGTRAKQIGWGGKCCCCPAIYR